MDAGFESPARSSYLVSLVVKQMSSLVKVLVCDTCTTEKNPGIIRKEKGISFSILGFLHVLVSRRIKT